MSYSTSKDPALEIAAGRVAGTSLVNKFGRATDADSGADVDIWDRANSSDSQDIWLAPTTARTHDIVSTSILDDGSPASTGARTLRVFGLTAWDADEVSEDITLNGATNVATANAYVIIHRMKVLTWGTAGPGVGTITATAQTDGTVTAQINIKAGQTQMAIYGVPSTKTAYVTNYYCSSVKFSGVTAVSWATSLLVNDQVDVELTKFTTKHTNGARTEGSTYISHKFNPYFPVPGPAIIKLTATPASNNMDISGGFDIIIEDA